MPLRYSVVVKNDRMEVVMRRLEGGWLRLLDRAGVPLAEFRLAKPAGTVTAGVLQFRNMPMFCMGIAVGKAVSAQLYDVAGVLVGDGLTVGTKDADVTMGRTDVNLQNIVRLDSAEIKHA